MNFKDTKLAAELTMLSGGVPIIVGERGIGKTALARLIANENDFHYVGLDANLLKEGEIGGLPTVVGTDVEKIEELKTLVKKFYAKAKGDNEEYASKLINALYKKGFSNDKAEESLRTVYAIHRTLHLALKLVEDKSKQGVLFAIDEFNRCEHAVQQELMNLILNREINGAKLPENIYLMAMQNPSSRFKQFEDSEYQTVDMDPAQEDRFVWYFMESDAPEWLDWASKIINEETMETQVHSHVIEFIATNPEVLNVPDSQDDIKPSPRSWERLSNTLKLLDKTKKDKYPQHIVYNMYKGNIGETVSTQLDTFIKESDNPIPKPEEILENKKGVPQDIEDRLTSEANPRLLVATKNCMNYLLKEKNSKKKIESHKLDNFLHVLGLVPKDVMVMIMINLINDYNPIHKELAKNVEYLNLYQETSKLTK